MLTDDLEKWTEGIKEEIAWWCVFAIVVIAIICGAIKLGVVK